jgi:hypothetical protein
MQREVLEEFNFIPFTGIGYITTPFYPPFDLCFPLMIEVIPISETLPEGYVLLEPQAKFELSVRYKRRKKRIETYYYMDFVFKKEHEATYDLLRRYKFPERYLTSLKYYDEVKVPLCIITQLYEKEKSGQEVYYLVHNFKQNRFAFVGDKSEMPCYVLPKCYCEGDLLDLIDEVVKREIKSRMRNREFKKLSDADKPKFSWVNHFQTIKILHLNEELQKVYNEKLSKAKQIFELS